MAFNLPHKMPLQQLAELHEAVTTSGGAGNARTTSTTTAASATTIHLLQRQQQQEQRKSSSDDKISSAKPSDAEEDPDEDDEVEDDGGDAGAAEEARAAAAAAAREIDDGGNDHVADSSGGAANSSLLPAGGASGKILGQDPNGGGASARSSGGGGGGAPSGPTWLSNAVLRQQSAAAAAAAATSAPNYSQWLSMPQSQGGGGGGASADLGEDQAAAAAAAAAAKGFLEHLHGDTTNSGGGGGSDLVAEQEQADGGGGAMDSKLWQAARLKADLVTHPLYEQLLSAHISCLRTATPVDQLPKIDAQLTHSSQIAAKYSILAANEPALAKDKDEVNEFMAHYVTLLRSFKDQLQQHVRVHAMEAVVACWELEQSLFTLTGVSPGDGTGATMSEDEDDQADSDSGYYDTGLDGPDFTGFGPLIPTETERTLMERVRHELKIELKQGYKAKINDVREEILRKRRAGKLPGDTTSVLKTWWHQHSKWPYPSEDDKARLVQETGLELKQINNWFINQRKRNWHSNPSSSTSLKNKRKR